MTNGKTDRDLVEGWIRYVEKNEASSGWAYPGPPTGRRSWIAAAESYAGARWSDENWDRWGMDSVKYADPDCLDECQQEELASLEWSFEKERARFAYDSAEALVDALFARLADVLETR